MDRTLEILTADGTAPAVIPSGGTLEADFTAQILLLGNRLTAIENSLATLTKAFEKSAQADEPPEVSETTDIDKEETE